MAELLLGKGYEVHGIVKVGSDPSCCNIAEIARLLTLHTIDLSNHEAVDALIAKLAPDEIYNLAAPSVVPASWINPLETTEFMTKSVTVLLEAIVNHAPSAHLVQATSSEIFRGCTQSPQNEQTCPAPRSPYGVSKLFAHSLIGTYRHLHGLHASSAILYNHESPRRPLSFVTKKIANAATQIKAGHATHLVLGDVSAQRDWGSAKDFINALWLMANAPSADDYVLATGVLHTVDDIVQIAFSHLGLDPQGLVKIDPTLVRKSDETLLVGDASHAKQKLGWAATTSFETLIREMVDSELESFD
ncbi:MAG: GDP-mannose 4,6-dehydratase [Thermoleophilaceae bacterium]|nr:GDP-mannose 4,6-dehydratase [Thermoleophilaceae bacterium]